MDQNLTWIRRIPLTNKKPYQYVYFDKRNQEIIDPVELMRFRSLAIPPMYHDVIINSNPEDKIQAIGIDKKGRKQYIYHKNYLKNKNEEKYCHMINFGKILPYLINDIDQIIQKEAISPNFPTKNLLIALAIKIMFLCNFRIGNQKYEKKYQTKGITTISPENIQILTDHVLINFNGKKGVPNHCFIYQDEINHIIKRLFKNNENQRNNYFFCYYDIDGEKRIIKSSDINNFLGHYGNFTSKNLRTWVANYLLVDYLVTEGPCHTKNECSKRLKRVVEQIAHQLHHTPIICKKSYLDKDIIDLYINHNDLWNSEVLHNYHKNGIFTPTHNLLLNLFSKSCALF